MATEMRTKAVQPLADAGARVRLTGVTRAFDGGIVALAGVDLQADPGAFIAILGPSGCGKSTLLRLVAGLDRPQGGRVVVDGGAAGGPANLGYVFQDAHLLPWRTVRGNVELPLELRGVARDRRRTAARDAVARVGLGEALERYPSQLSGGMRMRVSLARALVTRPHLLLLDEPFAAVDELTRQHLDEQLHLLWRRGGATMLFVTHSIAEAVFLAQRVVVLSARPARVVAEVEVDLPAARTAELRTDTAFNAVVRTIQRIMAGSRE